MNRLNSGIFEMEFNLSGIQPIYEKFSKTEFSNAYLDAISNRAQKIFTQRVLSGGDIQRIDLTNVADQWNGEENNFGLQIGIENGSSDHFR